MQKIVLAIIIALVLTGLVVFRGGDTPVTEESPSPTPSPTAITTTTPTATATPVPTTVPTATPLSTTTPPATTATPTSSSPTPAPQSVSIVADDNSYTPSGTIMLTPGTVQLTFNVRSENVYYGGLDFRGGPVNSGTILPGQSKTVTFTATSDFTITAYWPSSGVVKYSIPVTVTP